MSYIATKLTVLVPVLNFLGQVIKKWLFPDDPEKASGSRLRKACLKLFPTKKHITILILALAFILSAVWGFIRSEYTGWRLVLDAVVYERLPQGLLIGLLAMGTFDTVHTFRKEDLPQINLGMVSDSGNRLPLYYKIHDGSITDVSTLKNVLKEGHAFNMKNLTFVMDKGFFSKGSIEAMYSFDYHFIVSMSFTANAAFEAVDRVRDTIRHPRNVVCTTNGEYLYASSFETCWGAEDLKRKCRIHVYTKLLNDIAIRSGNLDLKLVDCLNELNSGEWNNAHAPLYARYFEETVCSDGSKSYIYNDEAIRNSENRYSGYLCIVTDNPELTIEQVIDVYRDKDGIEKVFDDVKNIQDCRRLNVQSRPVMEGKMFVVFIAAILVSEIRQRMKHNYRGKDAWTIDLIRKKLNRIRFSKVKVGAKAAKGLFSIVSCSQRAILSALFDVPAKDVEQTLKDAVIV